MYCDIFKKTFTNVHFCGVWREEFVGDDMFGERPGSKLKRVPSVYFFTVFNFMMYLYFIKKKKVNRS